MSNENFPLTLREPLSTDGAAVAGLVAQCPPLDTNSTYCNLLQCSHFAATSIAALVNDQLVGFISGYRIPARPDTLFIWQVAVGETMRGHGLAGKMIDGILSRPSSSDIKYLETSITETNQASWSLFEGFARRRNAQSVRSKLFDQQDHFAGLHDTEYLFRIGPLVP